MTAIAYNTLEEKRMAWEQMLKQREVWEQHIERTKQEK